MKKYLSLLLAFITIFSMGYIPAAADSTTFGVTYVASVSEVKPGDEFTVEAVFNGIENVTGFSITIDVANIKGNVYSTSKPTYISGEEAFVKNAPDNNNFAAMYESAVTLTGSYLRFSFKVDETNTESNIVIPFTTKITRPGEEGSKPVASENLVLTQKCDHALSFVAEVPSTCAVQGTKAHYVCSKCGALFADAGGTIATTAEALKLPLDPNNHGDGLSSTGWTVKDGENHAQTCKKCNREITEAHKWDKGVVTTPATHTTEGVLTYTCEICKATKTETIEKTPEHSFGPWTKRDGDMEYHYRTCACGTEQKEMHKWNDGVITVKPTHTEKGKKLFTCTVCDATKTVDVPPLTEHSFGDWSKLDDEYHHRFCVCGVEQKEMHKWNDGVITVKPTHTEKGKKLFTCTVCDATKTVDVPPLTEHAYGPWTKREGDIEFHYRTCVCGNEQKEAHKWDDGVITVVPTVDKDGTRTFTCKVCGAKKDVVEPYHVHDYDKDFDDVKWSANASYHWKRCACGEIAYKGAHVSSDWIVDGYPNPVSIGMMHKECVICGYVLAREILPATGVARPTQTTRYTVTASADANGSISHEGKTVVNSGDRITYVITPDDGYEIASVIVNGADVGAVREYTFWNVKSDCSIHATFREIPAAFVNPFIDVAESDAYFDAVMYVYENGLFKGVSETEFAPDTTMTRAMFVTVLGRMAGVNTQLYQKSSFNDVEMGQWYSPYVEWAAHCGIVLGYGDGTFGLNDEITVEQAAVILTRYAAFTGRNTYTLRTLHDFADAADVSDWAVYSMQWIVSSGIYTGENGMLSPKSLAKRSLVAAMLYNYAE